MGTKRVTFSGTVFIFWPSAAAILKIHFVDAPIDQPFFSFKQVPQSRFRFLQSVCSGSTAVWRGCADPTP